MKFLDEAKVYVRSGDGGRGCVSFRREKFVEFGGPDGGDGGRGGDVCVVSVGGLNTLIDFRYRQHFKAASGRAGAGRNRSGARGKDVILRVPVGVQLFDEDRGTLLADLDEVGKSVTLLHGGNGGFGNARFKSSVNRTPRVANLGLPGQERWVWLCLKTIADIGIVGLPNAGKSTLLTVLSAARPKVAAYPFTTKYPHLGVLRCSGQEYVLADIPGLIEGAHKGVGLGYRFLGHVERCPILLHLIDASREDVASDYCVVRRELAAYGCGVDRKPEFVVLSKSDIVDTASLREKLGLLMKVSGQSPLVISSVACVGLTSLVSLLGDAIACGRRESKNRKEGGLRGEWHP